MYCLTGISSQLDSLSDMACKDLHSELLHQIIKEVCVSQSLTHTVGLFMHAHACVLVSLFRFLHTCVVVAGIWQLSMNLLLGDGFLH